MSFPRDKNKKPLLVVRYSILGKNFIRDFVLTVIFLFIFATSFLIGWDIWIEPSGYVSKYKWYCAGISLLVAITVTVPISFFIKLIQKAIVNKKRKNEEQQKK